MKIIIYKALTQFLDTPFHLKPIFWWRVPQNPSILFFLIEKKNTPFYVHPNTNEERNYWLTGLAVKKMMGNIT